MDIIKTLAKSIREYKKQSILTMIIVFFEVILETLVPFVMSILLDQGLKKNDLNLCFYLTIVLVVMTVICFIAGVEAGFMASTAACGLTKNLRHDLYYKLQSYSFKNIDKFSSASIVTRITTDCTNVQNAYLMIIRTAIRAPIMLVLALILTFISSWIIGLIYLGIAILLGGALIFIVFKAHPYFHEGVTTYDWLNGVVQENLQGMRVVKSFNREEFENQKFNKISTKIYKLFSKGEKISAFNSPFVQFAIYAIMVILSYFGSRLIINPNTTMTTGVLSSLISYAWMVLNTLIMISMIFVTIIIASSSAERIYEMLVEQSDITSKTNPVVDVKNGDVEFRHVNFAYSEKASKLVLNDINFKVKEGEVVGILGGTGSSKTSLVNLIARLYDVTSGEVLVGDVNVKDYDLTALRDKIAVVLQKNTLFSGTIKDNLRWGDENATDEEMIEACKLAQADSFIEQFPNKYDTYIEQGGNNVSGGQKQRLCIARALLKKPKVLILDDSTSAVDTRTDALIREAFREKIPNTTKFIVAQRITSIQDADKIIVLDDGKIDDMGTHEELLARNKIYQEVYYTQNNKGGDNNE